MFYGKYESERLERDFYFLGNYVHSLSRDDQGKTLKERHDIFYTLFSFQENQTTHEIHQHVLPAGLWRSRSLPEDRTIFGPFYYHHRIAAVDQTTHHLSLAGGNLWLAKDVQRERLQPPAVPGGQPIPALETVSRKRSIFTPAACPR